MRMTFEEWKREIDRVLVIRIGLDSESLPDYNYRSDYDMHVPITVVCSRVIKAARNY